MTDFADLGIRVSSQEAAVAEDRLDDLAAAAGRAEGAVDTLGTSMKRTDSHAANMGRALQAQERHTKALSMAGLNLSRQFSDVGVTLAMGMNPFMVAIQQGPQIMDGFQQAAMQMGTSVRGAMIAMGTAIWTAVAPLLPIIAAVAAAAAVLGAAFALGTRAASQSIGDLTAGMNLTEAQMKKLKAEGISTTTTMGDVWRGLGTTIKEGFFDLFGDQIGVIDKKWNEFLNAAWRGVVTSTKNIVGGFVGALFVIRDTWKMLPAAIGDMAISAANLVIRGVESMINGGVRLLNVLVDKANEAAAKVGLKTFLPRLSEADLAEFANPFLGAMRALGAQGAESYGEGFTSGSGFVVRQAERLAENIRATGAARIRTALGATAAAVSDVGSSARDAADAADKLVERLAPLGRIQLRAIDIKMPEIVDPMIAELEKLSFELRLIEDLARNAGQGMAEAFGSSGKAAGDMLVVLAAYRTQQKEIALAQKTNRLSEAQASRQQAALEVQTYGDMASAAKGFFDEKSAGYRALQAVEQVYRAIQFANAVKAMVLDKTETGATVLQSGIKAAAHGVVAVAKAIASMPFPLNIAAGAATAAALVGFGVKMFGGGGGSSAAPALPETNTGTGTVLGDPSAQSQSINKSMELAEKYYNRDLSYSNDMLDALRAIQKGIGDVTTAIARQLGIGGKLSTDGLGLGSTSNPGFLGMFSSSRSSELADQGLNFGGQNLGQIISNGIAGSFYQIVQNTKTKSGFFGIGGGTSTWNTETSSGIDAGLSRDIANLLASLKSGVLSAAGKLGIEGAEAVLNAFQVNIGRISFKDMSSAEIAETLTAVFSAVGDQMAGAIMPTLTKYQAAGEGLMETLTRLAAQYQAVDQVMASLGMTFGAVGVGSIEARDRLVQLAGGLDEFVKSSTFFAEEFLTEAQRMGPIQSAVNAELARLGIATDITREQFANLVMGLDVSTESGAAMYAALMRLAPGLDKVLDYTEGLNGVIVDTAALLQQRQSLEIQLMEAQGRSAEALAAKRVLELAAMDASLRPLQEAIWAAQEAASAQAELARAQQEAADVARQIASQRRNLEIDLMSATGDVAGALAAKRADELAAMDASLRPLQQAIWTAQEAAAAQAELARAQQEAADIARQIASQRRDLEIELMEATGNSAGALAARRADELAAIDASLRPIKEAIWAAQDLAAAQAEATRAAEEATRAYEQQRQAMLDLVETARNDLTQAYQREAAALQETIDKFGGFSDSLRAFRKELDQIGSGSASYASTKAEFDRVAALARLGDAEALGGLQGVSKTFLDAAMSNASSQQAYLRDLALVKSAVDLAADTADRTKTAAERQLEALNASVAGLITLNESVLSVRDAIGALQEAMRLAGAYGITKFARGGVFTTPTYFDIGQMAEAGPEAIMPLHQGPNGLGVRAVNDNGSEGALLAEVRALRGEIAELKAAGVQTAVNTGQIKRQIDRQEVDGVYVRGEAPGDPVDVENAA